MGLENPATNVTGNDLQITPKIVLAYLNDLPDYYTRLYRMFKQAAQEAAEREALQA